MEILTKSKTPLKWLHPYIFRSQSLSDDPILSVNARCFFKCREIYSFSLQVNQMGKMVFSIMTITSNRMVIVKIQSVSLSLCFDLRKSLTSGLAVSLVSGEWRFLGCGVLCSEGVEGVESLPPKENSLWVVGCFLMALCHNKEINVTTFFLPAWDWH